MSSSQLMVSVSGVRGIVGESLLPAVVVQYVASFAALLKAEQQQRDNNSSVDLHVVVGRDSRVSGSWLQSVVCSTLQSCGVRVTALGIVATPTVQLAVQQLTCSGGVVVTASHNPLQWNGLKFIGSDSVFLDASQCARLYSLSHPSPFASALLAGSLSLDSSWNERHVSSLLSLQCITHALPALQRRPLRVALDTVCGAGGPVMRLLLERLHCTITAHLHPETSGLFPRNPEPLPEHLSELGQTVRDTHADLGIAVDPDVDRCVVLDERGEPVGEEYTLAMAAHYCLHTLGWRGPVVKNLSSSRVTDDVARAVNCETHAVSVGEVHVARAMQRLNAVIGGEGNGGVLLPPLHLGRDAPAAAALVLCFLASSPHQTTSAAVGALPRYRIAKVKAAVPPHFDAVLESLKQSWMAEKATISTEDGVRADFADGWLHVRKSNTEPVYRVIGEFGSDYETSLQRCNALLTQVQQMSEKITNNNK